jgi:ubiquinone/menaquinone biosynthesis C-methylase UbiE
VNQFTITVELGGQMERTIFDERREVPGPEGMVSDYTGTPVWQTEYGELWREPAVQAAAALDLLPIPPRQVREGYFDDRHLEYWLSGYADRMKILRNTKLSDDKNLTYLDFGGSSGRVARHFVGRQITPWCCDINIRSIDWAAKYLSPAVLAFQNRPAPHLPFEDNTFDIVSAFSVFTHIDLDEMSWLLELRRILKPGGFLYITVHDEHTWESIKTKPWKQEALGKGRTKEILESALQNGDLPSERFVMKYHDHGVYDVNVFVEKSYLQKRWAPFFADMKHFPREHDDVQSGIVLRK